MRFSIAASVAALSAIASATSETAEVTELSIRDNEGIKGVFFTIDGVKCAVTTGTLIANGKQVQCGTSPYSFGLSGPKFGYILSVTKKLSSGVDIVGSIKPHVYCHAGGNGVNDIICAQIDKISITLQ